MATSYSKWTLAELTAEKELIEQAIESKQGRERDDVMAKIAAVASKAGFALGELFDSGSSSSSSASPAPAASGKKKRSKKKSAGKRVSKAKGSKVAPKYRNPEDPEQTWAGRGRKPHWYIEAVAAGRTEEELAA